MHKLAQLPNPFIRFLAARWSPRAFAAGYVIPARTRLTLMEAARWAPSALAPSRGLSFVAIKTTIRCLAKSIGLPNAGQSRLGTKCVFVVFGLRRDPFFPQRQ